MPSIELTNPVTLSLSLANACNAHCPWCPIGKGVYHPRRNRYLTDAVLDAILSKTRYIKWEEIWFSENGESLLNPHWQEIVLKVQTYFPNANYFFASNMYLMDSKASEWLLHRGVKWFAFNLDGAAQETYGAVKGLDLETVKRNIEALVRNRDAINPDADIHANVLTLSHYYNATGQHEKITTEDDTREVFKYLRNLPSPIEIFLPFPLTWAERAERKIPHDNTFCLGLGQALKKFFVDTDGGVYCCCEDYDSEFTFGNIMRDSFNDIWFGKKHLDFLQHLVNKEYEAIGAPCRFCND